MKMLPLPLAAGQRDKDKLNILANNRGKCGVYCWTNLTNGKTYIGSSINLSVSCFAGINITILNLLIKVIEQ